MMRNNAAAGVTGHNAVGMTGRTDFGYDAVLRTQSLVITEMHQHLIIKKSCGASKWRSIYIYIYIYIVYFLFLQKKIKQRKNILE